MCTLNLSMAIEAAEEPSTDLISPHVNSNESKLVNNVANFILLLSTSLKHLIWSTALFSLPSSKKLAVLQKLISLFRLLYTNVEARLIIDGELQNLLDYSSGVKQGCKLAPTLYGVYAAIPLWVAFKEIKQGYQLRTFQQRHLRSILKIKWDDFISNEEVLRRSGAEDIEILLAKSKLRWFGQVVRMDDSRYANMLLCGK